MIHRIGTVDQVRLEASLSRPINLQRVWLATGNGLELSEPVSEPTTLLG